MTDFRERSLSILSASAFEYVPGHLPDETGRYKGSEDKKPPRLAANIFEVRKIETKGASTDVSGASHRYEPATGFSRTVDNPNLFLESTPTKTSLKSRLEGLSLLRKNEQSLLQFPISTANIRTPFQTKPCLETKNTGSFCQGLVRTRISQHSPSISQIFNRYSATRKHTPLASDSLLRQPRSACNQRVSYSRDRHFHSAEDQSRLSSRLTFEETISKTKTGLEELKKRLKNPDTTSKPLESASSKPVTSLKLEEFCVNLIVENKKLKRQLEIFGSFKPEGVAQLGEAKTRPSIPAKPLAFIPHLRTTLKKQLLVSRKNSGHSYK